MKNLTNVVNQVGSRKEAEALVVELLQVWASDAAYDRVVAEASDLKQKPSEILKRRVTNLFSSFKTHRS